MSTVFQRVKHLCNVEKKPLLPRIDRMTVGKQVAEAYRLKNGELPQKRILLTEPDGKFMVQWYPTEFIPEMDAIIIKFVAASTFTLKSVTEPVMVAVKKRKRIPIRIK